MLGECFGVFRSVGGSVLAVLEVLWGVFWSFGSVGGMFWSS